MTVVILVIDDSEDDQRLYQRAFKDFDCVLEMVSTAEAGLERIAGKFSEQTGLPGLILLDYNLPEIDGLSFMKQLAAHTDSSIPIVMLTGEGSTAVAVEAMRRGADDYLVKDAEGRYLRLLPSVAARAMAAQAQRDQARKLLRRNQILMQNAMDGIHIMDMRGDVVEVNDAFCHMLGYSQEEAMRLNVTDWDAQWSAAELRARFEWQIGKSSRFETVHRRKDGGLIDVEISTTGMEVDGEFLLYAASRDITERKRAEGVLQLNKTIIEAAYDGFWRFDLDGYLLDVNQAYADMIGYAHEELLGKHISQLSVQSSTPELVRARIEKAIRDGLSHFETQHRHKNGHVVDFEASISYIPEANCLFSFIRDITDRKKAEAVLRQYKLALDTSLDGFWVCDMQGYLLEANEAYAKLSGYTVAELVGMHISQLEAIELNPEVVRAHIAKVVAQGYDRFETRHRHKDGHEIDIEIAVTYMAEPQRTVGFCRDISERKRAEAIRIREEANLRALLDNSPYLSWLKDTEGRYITINKVFADYLGLDDASHAAGKTDLDLQPKELAEKYRTDDAMVMQTRKQKHVEESAFDGERTHWVETYKTPIIDGGGKVLGTVGFARDITGRKQMQLQTEILLRRNQALMRTSMDGIHVLDMEGNVVEANDAFCRMLGYGKEEVAGLNAAEWEVEFSGEELRARFQGHLGKSAMIETVHRRKDGTLIDVEISVTGEVIDGQGLLFCSSRDISMRKRTERELALESKAEHRRAEKLAQQFGQLLQSSVNEIYLFDATSLHFIETSAGAEENLGYSAEEMERLTLLDLDLTYTRESFETLVAPLRNGERQGLFFNTSLCRRDGSTYPVEMRLQLMQGELSMFLAIAQDITERRAAEEILRFHSNILESMTEGIHLVRASDGVIVFANPQIEHMFGYGPGELVGKHVSVINAPCERTPEDVAREINGELAREGVWSGEVQNIRKDGTVFWCHASVSTFEHSCFGKVWVSVHEDITRRKQSEQQARELSAHLQTVREEEKAGFAREIHDDLGATLAALKMDAHWLAGRLGAGKEMEPLQVCAKSMIGLLDTAVSATRRIITDLRPTVLDDLGLLEALKWQSAEFHKRTGIECKVICRGGGCDDGELGGMLPINLFRIFQEALNNVARHSGASRVEVDLQLNDDEVILSISDNGRGLPESHSVAPTSYGMRGMHERVAQLEGSIEFGRPPGGGLRVEVMLPLSPGQG